MPTAQALVHTLEEGKGRTVVLIVVVVLSALALTAWYDGHEFKNFAAAEAMETAQLARNISEGRGFTTQCIRPLTLYLVDQKLGVEARLSEAPHPDLNSPPVYPLVLAGLMKILPFEYEIAGSFWRYQPEFLIALLNQVLFLVVVLVGFLLARRLFDTTVAVVTAIVLLLSDQLWRFSVSGLSTLLLMLLFLGVVWCLIALEQGAASEEGRDAGWYAKWALAIGILMGLGALTRYSFGWLLFPVVAFCGLYATPRRWLVGAIVVLAFVVIVTPWLVRNYQLSGTLFGVPGFASYQETPSLLGTRLERSLDPDLSHVGLRDFIRKLFVNLRPIFAGDLYRMGGGWMAAFFLPALFLPYRRASVHRLRIFAIMALGVTIVAQALGRTHLSADTPDINTENLLVVLSPLVFCFGVGVFQTVLTQLDLPFPEMRQAVTTVFVLGAGAPLILTLLPPRTFPIAYPPYYPPWIQESAQLLTEDEMMMSDAPWAVAWYGDRTCIWTTLDSRETFFEVHDQHKPITALYLTPLTTDARFLSQVLQGIDWEWSRFAADVLLDNELPDGFPLLEARSRYAPDQLFLCGRRRWLEQAP